MNFEVVKKGNINYIYKSNKLLKYKPWLGDLFSFFYDNIMKKSVFPKKFGSSLEKHYDFFNSELKKFDNFIILDLACGNASISKFLNKSNFYYGIDISKGLLKNAIKNLNVNGFQNFELYLANASELPFEDDKFDVCLCNLAINFFNDLDKVLTEIKRVLKDKGVFIGVVPVPEKNYRNSKINGTLYSEKKLESIFEKNGFNFKSYNYENGALLYFKSSFTI
ncbi:hypothetical protein OSSY52_04610 [Tepiditoga spiralis]|uniref:Methyltransferase domain-containing protein n=1 Tax=Tepiditoga spiralis TaxID=2108365 RepID=A0A7G1G1Z6_9BACT|nr:class I SAM-dependent methyltransferase [Tepiditoga spiralis]BBE30320.1 hypothetical protein OSSY52_04610 [Tepiditoga spiralis]